MNGRKERRESKDNKPEPKPDAEWKASAWELFDPGNWWKIYIYEEFDETFMWFLHDNQCILIFLMLLTDDQPLLRLLSDVLWL